MGGRSKLSINGRAVDINSDSVVHVFSYIMEALMDDPKTRQSLFAYLERFIKGESAPETETVLEDKDQDSYTAKQPSTHSASKFPSSRISQASSLYLILKDIISKHCKSSDVNVSELLFGTLEALMHTPKGKERVLSCLQRMSQAMYLNSKRVSNSKGDTIFEDKAHDCDTTKASCLEPPTQAASTSSTRKKSKAIKINDNIKIINLGELVIHRWDAIRETPQGEKRLLSQLRRISLEAKKEYLSIKAINTPKTEEFFEDNIQDCHTEASNHAVSALTGRKSKACFEHVCELFVTRYKLPEELLLAQSIYCAKTALAFYNKEYGTEYKLIEPLSSARHLDCGVRFHCNFTAAKILKNSSRTSQSKLFYADFRCFRKKVSLMHCCIIDPAKATFLCCEEFCPPDLAHCDERSTRRLPLCNNCVSPTKLIEAKNQFCANTALDFYNAKHGTKFKLVKSLESTIVPISFGIYRFSCNFKAKLKKNGCSPKLFFGELVCSNRSRDVRFSKDENRWVFKTAQGLVYHT